VSLTQPTTTKEKPGHSRKTEGQKSTERAAKSKKQKTKQNKKKKTLEFPLLVVEHGKMDADRGGVHQRK
jgi:hypothetical protein